MKTLVHLSDLHFGRDRPELETPLIEAVNGIAPDLVVISGDFTQRARPEQFRQAEKFVQSLTPPVLSVPGNHDTPLDNLFVRFLMPWRRYRRAIDPVLEPDHSDDDMVVTGVNTVNRFSWQRGRISERTVGRVCRAFEDAGDRLRVVVLHHPLEHGPHVDKRLMRGAVSALGRLEACGADVVLSGHLHSAVLQPFRAAPGLLFVQAGTVLSDRLRGEGNTFNVLRADPDHVEIETWGTQKDTPAFVPDTVTRFERGGDGWRTAA